MTKRFVYLDHAATTPLLPAVFRAMRPYFETKFGNPHSLYALGREAKAASLEARRQIALALGSQVEEIIFTPSATAADELALIDLPRRNQATRNQILISALEHKGITAVARQLKKDGWEIGVIPVLKNGELDLDRLKKMLNEKVALVSVTMADSETGTIQPLKEISKLIKTFDSQIIFHTDASQAAAHLPIKVKKLGVDALTLSAHKLGGPKGIAALYVKGGLSPNLRHTGTENVPAVVGFGAAVALTEKNKKEGVKRIKKLRDELERGLRRLIPKTLLNGHPSKRLPNFCNLSFLDVEGEAVLLYLDELGIMASTGSACDAENLKPSAVLTALGNPYEFVHGSIRFTLGSTTTTRDIKYVLKVLPDVIKKLRQISPLNLEVK